MRRFRKYLIVLVCVVVLVPIALIAVKYLIEIPASDLTLQLSPPVKGTHNGEDIYTSFARIKAFSRDTFQFAARPQFAAKSVYMTVRGDKARLVSAPYYQHLQTLNLFEKLYEDAEAGALMLFRPREYGRRVQQMVFRVDPETQQQFAVIQAAFSTTDGVYCTPLSALRPPVKYPSSGSDN